MISRKTTLLLASVLTFRTVVLPAADEKALEIANSMMKAMGGPQKWNAAHFVRYDFVVTAGGKKVVERSHLWDKQTGRYRLEQVNKGGENVVVLFNINTKQGSAYVNTRRIDGPEADEAVKDAYGSHINDMYWLSMPWKWLDQGVNLKYLGPQLRGTAKFDVVQLTFGNVGLTPGDTYKAFVSPESHLMTHWEYVLQGGNKGSWDWKYTETAGGKLAADHTSDDGKSINMGTVRILSEVPEEFFMNPSRTLKTLK